MTNPRELMDCLPPKQMGRMMVFVLVATCPLLIARTYLNKRVSIAPSSCAKPRIYVGVFTDGGGVEKYANRRASLRTTWFPNTTYARTQLECKYGMTVRFVVGQGVLTNDTRFLSAWRDEQADRDDEFLKLDVVDTYQAQTGKTDKFFRHVMGLRQNYEYVLKVDDDMFVSPSHLSKAVEQWSGMKADYIGCMIHGNLINIKGQCTAFSAGYYFCSLVFNKTSKTPFLTTLQATDGTSHLDTCLTNDIRCTQSARCMPCRERRYCRFSRKGRK
jgi:hypothetical protein